MTREYTSSHYMITNALNPRYAHLHMYICMTMYVITFRHMTFPSDGQRCLPAAETCRAKRRA